MVFDKFKQNLNDLKENPYMKTLNEKKKQMDEKLLEEK